MSKSVKLTQKNWRSVFQDKLEEALDRYPRGRMVFEDENLAPKAQKIVESYMCGPAAQAGFVPRWDNIILKEIIPLLQPRLTINVPTFQQLEG